MKPEEFVKGKIYKREDLRSAFGGGFFGGINVSHKTKSIILLSARYANPDYLDTFKNGFLNYTGEGLKGHQTLTGKNKTLFNAKKMGYKIYLFLDFKKTEHTFYGIYEIVGDYWYEKQKDVDGAIRDVLMFKLGESKVIRLMSEEELSGQLTAGPIKPSFDVVGACIEKDGQILCAQRGYGSLLGKWEFPGGKIEPGESPKDALIREIKEELDVDIEVKKYVGKSNYEYEDKIVNLEVYKCKIVSGEINDHEHKSLAWKKADQIATLDWADADIPLVEEIVEEAEQLKIDEELVKFNYFEVQPKNDAEKDKNSAKRAVQDYEKSMKAKAQSGARAELAVIAYEKDKLLDDGHPELSEKVQQVSLISSDFGYDVKSFKYRNGKYEEFHIEVKYVKVTENYLTFFISANELDKFKNDDNYAIYCVFKSGKHYKLHIVDRNLFRSEYLTPLTYQVRIKISQN